MNRRLFGRAGLLALLGLTGARAEERAEEKAALRHRIALQVGVNDPALMNLALGHIETLVAHYAAAGEGVAIDLTACGPGYRMLRADASPVRARIAEIRARHPFVLFSACQEARAALAREAGREPAAIPQVPEARDVPAGVVHLTQLQEQGWSYLRP
ncbi:hypothetical protein [Methylobacterium dankookense]|uniref:Uncharacterized protein n=1 Tax=Methylobacterium dankookense TaxID=560405 RepID=A0A564FZ52_9HYPH|nr:hypothetical protein [Methylobacterium dankookense]GJD58714.1 hypothetical protein IFDJLNFL_4637 [Methylobacterium dankookense]VUF13076.1 hypothetical protein MTDSW087_02774 [Methylobacterium dankookense]